MLLKQAFSIMRSKPPFTVSTIHKTFVAHRASIINAAVGKRGTLCSFRIQQRFNQGFNELEAIEFV